MSQSQRAVIPLEHTRIAPLRNCESCAVKMARHRLEMPGSGPTYELCDRCVEGFRQ